MRDVYSIIFEYLEHETFTCLEGEIGYVQFYGYFNDNHTLNPTDPPNENDGTYPVFGLYDIYGDYVDETSSRDLAYKWLTSKMESKVNKEEKNNDKNNE